MSWRSQSIPTAFLLLVVALTWWVYQPGLSGGFLFDDFDTLPKLGDYGGIRTADDVRRFVFNGVTGPTGRPIALVSFLADDNGWPSDPYAFKRTNLLLHLICGLILAWLAMAMLQALRWPADRAARAGALAAAIWLLHPLLVSTTLYVVQRMAILSALFMLIGLLVHVQLRTRLSDARDGENIGTLVLMSVALGLFSLLAFLSKENGALLPTLALVLEATVLARPGPRPPLLKIWIAIFLVVPTLVIAGYLIHSAATFGPAGEAYRGFSILQRLQTEGRALVSYLYALAIPRIETAGIYHDDFALSTGWLAPPTTLLSWGSILVMVGSAWVARHRHALISSAVLLFFAAHLLESTVIPLELYFEHRNYLPAAFLAIGAGAALSRIDESRGKVWVAVAAMAIVAILAGLTAARATMWGDTDRLLLFWAEKAPGSERAQLEAAQAYLRRDNTVLAAERLDVGLSRHPQSVGLLVVRLGVQCSLGRDTRADFAQLTNALRTASYGPNTYRAMEVLFEASSVKRCASLRPDDWHAFADALSANASVAASTTSRQQALFFVGLAALRTAQPAAATAAFSKAIETRYEYEAGMRMVAELASCGFLDDALALLERVERADMAEAGNGWFASRDTSTRVTHRSEFRHLEETIVEDRNQRGSDEHAASTGCR